MQISTSLRTRRHPSEENRSQSDSNLVKIITPTECQEEIMKEDSINLKEDLLVMTENLSIIIEILTDQEEIITQDK